jgi:hypothetical protein
MHRSIYQLCCVLNRKGVPQYEAERYIDANIYPLDKIPPSNCITDPYQRFKHQFGIWADNDQPPTRQPDYKPRPEPVGRVTVGRPDAPHGFNPYTGETFDQRGYPASWDNIKAPEPGTPEYDEITLLVLREMDAEIDHSADPDEINSFWQAQDDRTKAYQSRYRISMPQSRAG